MCATKSLLMSIFKTPGKSLSLDGSQTQNLLQERLKLILKPLVYHGAIIVSHYDLYLILWNVNNLIWAGVLQVFIFVFLS